MYRMSALLAGLVVLAALAGASGCGPRTTQVQGVVTLDGQSVEGATVNFVPEDPNGAPAAGFTDASGKFTLSTAGKPGARRGTYKVVVFKVKPVAGNENMKPGTPEYTKAMAEQAKKQGGAKKIPTPFPGMPMPKGTPTLGAGIKSELPAVYAEADKTPLTAKVPPANQPITIELKSKP